MTAYINPDVDLHQLGILAIGLGGSRAHSSHNGLADWDGIGILPSKKEICHLITALKIDLCKLLWIEHEECPSWSGIDARDNWDVLRFSGRAKDGTKRSIKLWSVEYLRAAYLDRRLCRIGVLSYRPVRTFRRYHPKLGPILYAYQPKRVMNDFYILEDADFLVPESDMEGSPHPNPGVTCDLLLTSVAVFANSILDVLKSAMILKWSKFTETKEAGDLVELLYSSKTFNLEYRRKLQGEIARLRAHMADDGIMRICQDSPRLEPLVRASVRASKGDLDTYWLTCFIGLPHISSLEYSSSNLGQTYQQQSITTPEFILDPGFRYDVRSPFSSNSLGFYTRSMPAENHKSVEIFAKSGSGVAAEVAVFPTLQAYFPSCILQRVLAYNPVCNSVYYERHPGRTLNDIRLTLETPFQQVRDAFDWFVNVEFSRAQEVTAVHLKTIRLESTEQEIHRFYYDRLHLDSRAKEFYGTTNPAFFETEQNRRLTFDDFMSRILIINGQRYNTLHQYFRQAEIILDPQGRHLRNSSTAVGFGDGHGGNVMVTFGEPAMLRFIDYEVAGWLNPVLDLAKPLYNDAFFSILYSDLLYHRHGMPARGSNKLGYRVTDEAIIIDFDIQLSLLDRTLGYIKLEHMMRPLWERLAAKFPSELETSEEILGAALFSCAVLTRNFSSHPEAFFLNTAIGVLLLTELRSTLDLFFTWGNWPQAPNDGATASEASLRSSGVLMKKSAPTYHVVSEQDMQQLLALRLFSLEPETVFLKRFDKTLQLHRRFSKNENESSAKVITRIGLARKLGIKIAPHTCIRECIFAEPRIDHHFQYGNVISQGQASDSIQFVDVGCCMGTDIRKLIVDGFAAKVILGLDIQQEFFRLGEILYNEDSVSQGFQFRCTDVLAENFCSQNADLGSRFDSVHSANVIHLFAPAQQVRFFTALAFLVKPGGLIWGRQVGLSEVDLVHDYRHPSGKGARFTAAAFKTLIYEATGWAEDEVTYEHRLVEYEELRVARQHKHWVLQWSVRVPLNKESKARLVEVAEKGDRA